MNLMVVKCYNIHNIVKFKIIDRHNHTKNFLTHLNEAYSYFEVDKIDKPDIIFNIGPFNESIEDAQILDEKYYVKKNYLFCRDSYKKAKWKLQIHGFEKGMMKVDVNTNTFGQLFISGYIIDPIVRLKILEKGNSMIHAACLSKDGTGYILAARSGVGKTFTSISLADRGLNFLGDNWIILHGSEILSFPCPLKIFSFNMSKVVADKLSHTAKIWLKIKNVVFILTGGYVKIYSTIEPHKIIPDSIIDKAKNKVLLFAIKGKKFDIKSNVNRDDIISQLVTNNMFEMFPFFTYMLEYSFVFPESKIALFVDNMREYLKKYLKNVKIYKLYLPEKITSNDLNKIYDFMVSFYERENQL